MIPIDRQAGAAEVTGARESEAVSLGKLPVTPAPARCFDNLLDATPESDGTHAQPVGRDGVGGQEMVQADVGGVHAEVVRQLVQQDFEREPRLWCPVSSLRAARCLARESSCPLKAVAIHLIGHRLQRAGVVRAGHPVRPVPAAIEQRAEMQPRDMSIASDAGACPHEDRMPPTVTVEHFFTGERHLDRPSGHHRKLGYYHFVIERVALAAEPAPIGARDDPDARGREVEHLAERTMDVVRRLGRRPQRELARRRPVSQGRVLFHGQVGVALVEEHVFAHVVGFTEGGIDVAKLQVDQLVQVPTVTVVVNGVVGLDNRILGPRNGLEHVVLHLDQVQRGGCDLLGGRGDSRHRVTDEARLVGRERMLILADWQDAERCRQVAACEHRLDSLQPLGPGGIDRANPRVRMRAAQQLGPEHAGQDEIVGKPRAAGHLGNGVGLDLRLPDDAQVTGGHAASPAWARPARRACAPPQARPPRRSSSSRYTGRGCPPEPP